MNNLDKQYTALLQDILDNGIIKKDRTGTGTLSVFGRTIRHKMSEGFPLITTKKMPLKIITTELLWFLRGDTNIKFLVDNGCHIWDGDSYKNYVKHWCEKNKSPEQLAPSQNDFINLIKSNDEFAKKWGELGPIYGKQWRSWKTSDTKSLGGTFWGPTTEITENSIDQIQNLINDIKTNPDSRRLMVSAWNVGELDQMTLPPCHYGFQVYTRELSMEERKKIYERDYTDGVEVQNDHWLESKLTTRNVPTRAISLMYNARSQDVPLGTPFNISSYALLLEIIGKIVNMIPDELIANMGDCHIYLNQIDGIKEQLTREPYELPTLDIHPVMLDYDLDKLPIGLFTLKNYQSHPSIKMPLSN
jgi:thymidylate synthase